MAILFLRNLDIVLWRIYHLEVTKTLRVSEEFKKLDNIDNIDKHNAG